MVTDLQMLLNQLRATPRGVPGGLVAPPAVLPDFSNVQGNMVGMVGGVEPNWIEAPPAVVGVPQAFSSGTRPDGTPATAADLGLTPAVPAPTAITYAATQPQPAASAAAAGTPNTLCDLGLCAPGGGSWAAGDGTTLWDRQMNALLLQNTGGIDAITQNDAAGRRRSTADLRATPEWEAQFRAAMANTGGNSAAAAAVADRNIIGAAPGAGLGYIENLAGANEQAVDNFRSQLLGTAAYLNQPDVAAPAFGATPGFNTAGIENFYRGADGAPVVRVNDQSFAAPNAIETYALGPNNARSGVGGQLARSDAGQQAIAKLLATEGQINNPVPLQQALLSIAQQAVKDPTGTNGGMTPIMRTINEAKARQLAKDRPELTAQQILAAIQTGIVPPVAVAAPAAAP